LPRGFAARQERVPQGNEFIHSEKFAKLLNVEYPQLTPERFLPYANENNFVFLKTSRYEVLK